MTKKSITKINQCRHEITTLIFAIVIKDGSFFNCSFLETVLLKHLNA